MVFNVGDLIRTKTGWGSDIIYQIIEEQDKCASEYHQRFVIKNINTGVIIDGSYLYNGCWEKLSITEIRELKLERIVNGL